MKIRLLNCLFFFLSAFLIGTGCTKEVPGTWEEAVITGPDYRRCASPYCGGWFFTTKTDSLRFLTLPVENELNNFGDSFPYPVWIIYRKYEDEWREIEDLVEIEDIQKREE
jgi:hypothetical protein